jgi:acetolactate synthase I/III small subunit
MIGLRPVQEEDMGQILSLLVRDKAGALSQIVGLFGRHGYNITSLNVAPTHQPGTSLITLSSEVDEQAAHDLTEELATFPDVMNVGLYNPMTHVAREMALVRVRVREENRGEVLALSDVFRARVIDASPSSYIFEVTGQSEKIDAFLQNMSVYGIREVHRTGKLALTRGAAADQNSTPGT